MRFVRPIQVLHIFSTVEFIQPIGAMDHSYGEQFMHDKYWNLCHAGELWPNDYSILVELKN